MIFLCQSKDILTLIMNPRWCNKKVNVSLPISNSSFDAAFSKILSRYNISLPFSFLNKAI